MDGLFSNEPETIGEMNEREIALLKDKARLENLLDKLELAVDCEARDRAISGERRMLRMVKLALEEIRIRRGALKAAGVEARSKERERLILNAVRTLFPAELEKAIAHARETNPDAFSGPF